MDNGIVDLIIRLKNGYMAKKESIESPASNLRTEVLQKLKALKYIKDYEMSGDVIKRYVITLQYNHGSQAMTDVKIFSTPGRRWYVSVKDLKPVMSGMGFAILSTSKGILTNIEAKKQKIGGELLFEIW